MIWIIIGIIYLLSAFGAWKYFHLAYSKGGVYAIYDFTTEITDIFIVFTPILNTFFNVNWTTNYPKVFNSTNYNKFFKIK